MQSMLHFAPPRCSALALCLMLGAAVPCAQATGRVVAWGDDSFGQVSNAPNGANFVDVAAGWAFGVALRSDGSLKAWGDNDSGEVSTAPKGGGFVDVEAGDSHAYALRSDGSIAAWGSDSYGQTSQTPTSPDFVMVSAGGVHGVALRSDGSLESWGDGGYGQLNTPTGNDFIAVDATSLGSLALRSDGSLVYWGYQYAVTPADLGFMKIDGGGSFALAMRPDGSFVVWGNEDYGGFDTCGARCAPKGPGFVDAVAGHIFGGLALRGNGSLLAWGRDPFGWNVAEQTPTGRGFEDIARGGSVAYAIRAIPEPATYALMLLGLAGLSIVARRRTGHRAFAGAARVVVATPVS